MPCFFCRQCGTQFADSSAPPAHCPICEDDRQYVRWAGQDWLTLEELRSDHRLVLKDDAGILGIGIEPAFAIGQRALMVETDDGNVLWDCVSLVTDDAVAEIGRRGGLSAIAISHPHYYSAVVEWSEAFGGIPIHLHANDRQWVMRPHRAIRHWAGEALALGRSVTLIHCGGHFPGGTVLHWRRHPAPSVVLSGDILQVVPDRRHVSFMYSYPNYIPMNARAVRQIAAAVEPYAFDSIHGAWWGQNIIGGAREAVSKSVARYLEAIA